MCEGLPRSIDPRRLAEQRRSLTGEVGLSRLPRLAQIVVQSDADTGQPVAGFELNFGRDAAGRGVVEGRVTATLTLRCQRCNETFSLPVESRFKLALVSGIDEAARLPEDYEPLLPDEDSLDPAVLVEDELLLAVPTVPRHPEGACEAPAFDPAAEANPDRDPASEDKPNPFAVLSQLKRPH
jgi:uncharacterized protein